MVKSESGSRSFQICLKCLEKDPKKRYETAAALATMLSDGDGTTIRARHIGVLARGKKWIRRNPTTTVLAGSLIALLLAIGAMIWKSDFVHPLPVTGIAVLPFESLSEDKANGLPGRWHPGRILTRLSKIAV